ncbi:hypothetical protein [Weissella oryzae]|uniref:hypothetical protein n=1 Tax=Weissella oryzae TaxID=1129792 RepID=UPI000484EBDB|nr:hypothetical protein [Weissella oryzae]
MRKINRTKQLLMGLILVIWLIMIAAQWNTLPLSHHADLYHFQLPWWNYLSEHGFKGIATINQDINGNYGPIWYFIIVLFNKIGLYPALTVEHCIKLMTSILILICSLVAMRIVAINSKDKQHFNDILAFAIVIFSPTLFGDLFKTNLPDSFYYLFALLAILSVIKKLDWLGWLFMGVAISFKAMGMYILPTLFFIYLIRFNQYKLVNKLAPLFSIIGMFICAIPGIVFGMKPLEALLGNIISRSSKTLSIKFGFWRIFDGQSWIWWPTLNSYQQQQMYGFGLAILAIVFLGLYILIYATKNESDQYLSLWYLLVLSPLLFWFFLPAQHETYFGLSPLLSSLLFAQFPNRRNLVILLIANFFIWEGYHGFQQIFTPITYFYLILLLVAYLIYEIIKLSKIKRFFLAGPNLG